VAEVIPEEGVIIIDCEKWTVFGTPATAVDVFGIISVMGDVEVRLARNGEEIPIAIQETGPSTFTVTAPELVGGEDLSVEEYARPMISRGGLQCVGLAYTVQLCPLEIETYNIELIYSEVPEGVVVTENTTLEGSLQSGLFEGTAPGFGDITMEWDVGEITPGWQISMENPFGQGEAILYKLGGDSQRCDATAQYFDEATSFEWEANVTLPPPP
jgi:hypothetical protein